MSTPDDQDRDQSYEEFVRIFTRHEPRLRAFVRSLLPTWDDVDEVMQETSLVLWRKWNDFDPESDFKSVDRLNYISHFDYRSRTHVLQPGEYRAVVHFKKLSNQTGRHPLKLTAHYGGSSVT